MVPAADTPLILVADDSEANCELLGEQLSSLGYRPLIAHDGPSALDLAIERRPSLVILDVNMPAGDLQVDDRATGFEVCRRLKRDARTARIPVIFITALNESTDRVRAIEAGGDDFISKPPSQNCAAWSIQQKRPWQIEPGRCLPSGGNKKPRHRPGQWVSRTSQYPSSTNPGCDEPYTCTYNHNNRIGASPGTSVHLLVSRTFRENKRLHDVCQAP